MLSSRGVVVVATAALAAAALSGCSGSSATDASTASDGRITAVGAENQYTSVIAQVGGKYVSATSVMSNPNTDPHGFETSARIAATVGSAQLVVQNGLGYDAFMDRIEAATPKSSRVVIVAQKVLALPDSTANPHLWYDPKTMPAVAEAIAKRLSSIQPAHAAYFAARLSAFTASLAPWTRAIAALRAAHPGAAVATTEPVADDLLQAASLDNRTPFSFQAAIMNDTDPAPQDAATQKSLFTEKRVQVFVYNRQVTDALTTTYLQLARQHGIPVVGVYETMPTDGYSYPSWMRAEVAALAAALDHGTSTQKL